MTLHSVELASQVLLQMESKLGKSECPYPYRDRAVAPTV